MSTIHKNYSLSFINRKIDTNQVWKDCTNTNPNYAELGYYISQIQFIESITELYVPTINAIVNNTSTDNTIASGSSDAEIGIVNTQITGSNGLTVNIPTSDFKTILEEYATFLQTPPLDGEIVG